MSDS
jgi:ABC-type multidrug transport system fused ATPase/permease subunit